MDNWVRENIEVIYRITIREEPAAPASVDATIERPLPRQRGRAHLSMDFE